MGVDFFYQQIEQMQQIYVRLRYNLLNPLNLLTKNQMPL